MTTAIALETSQEATCTLALGLGIVLLMITLALNAGAYAARSGFARATAG